MPLFYAYLKDSANDLVWRYIVTFVNREAADEWWRLLSAPSSPYAAKIKRIDPQFYVHADYPDVVNFFNNTSLPDAKNFLNKMFFTLLNDRDGRILSIAPPADFTDHTSGKWYFIRSQDDPHRHWYFSDGGVCPVCGVTNCQYVHVSTEYRSRFFIQVYNAGTQVPKDFVIIGSDQVTITTLDDYILRVNEPGNLVGTKAPSVPTLDTLFLFSGLRDRFVTRLRKPTTSSPSYEYVKAVERGSGGVWDLTN